MNLHVYYDLRFLPNTFDFAPFLAGANAYREKIGCEGIELTLIASSFRKRTEREYLYDEFEKKYRLQSILIRLPLLINTIKKFSVLLDEVPNLVSYPFYPPNYNLVEPKNMNMYFHIRTLREKFLAYKEALKPFAAPKHAIELVKKKYEENFYTLTLRGHRFQKERNSNLKAWKKFLEYCDSLEKRVIIIPDMEDLYSTQHYVELPGCKDLVASVDITFRMALYALAIDNFCVSNGTSSLLIHSKYPYKMFGLVCPNVSNCTYEFVSNATGLEWNQRIEFQAENQSIIWERDDFDIIKNYI